MHKYAFAKILLLMVFASCKRMITIEKKHPELQQNLPG